MSHSEETHSHLEHPQGISAYYGELVFGPKAQQGYLSAVAIAEIHKAVTEGHTVHRDAADEIASGMKRWALDMGATHYTHWFQTVAWHNSRKNTIVFLNLPV